MEDAALVLPSAALRILPTIATLSVHLPPYLGSSIDALRATASCMFLLLPSAYVDLSIFLLEPWALVADDMRVCHAGIVHVYQECVRLFYDSGVHGSHMDEIVPMGGA